MRALSTALATALCFATLAFAIGCGDDHAHTPEPYDTFQMCFDDHAVVESLPVKEAIVICCLEHPIAGVTMACGMDAAACSTYLGANLAATSATPTEVTEACADYIAQMNM